MKKGINQWKYHGENSLQCSMRRFEYNIIHHNLTFRVGEKSTKTLPVLI